MTKFIIDQLALALPSGYENEKRALNFLRRCGMREWVEDTVAATGTVNGVSGSNVANLRFNYEAFDGKELELLKYQSGNNWLSGVDKPAVSHIGMHCTEADLREWRKLMAEFEVPLAQEVWTDSHTNPRIRNCRRYHYVIYATRDLIGVDMKFIVREITDQAEEDRQLQKLQEAASRSAALLSGAD